MPCRVAARLSGMAFSIGRIERRVTSPLVFMRVTALVLASAK